MKKWYLRSKKNLEFNKTSLSLEYRIVLKKKNIRISQKFKT